MPPTLNTPRVRIDWTNIRTVGTDRDVIRNDWDDLELTLGVSVNPSVWNDVSVFCINWRIVRLSDNRVFNHLYKGYTQPLTGVANFMAWRWWQFANMTGVAHGNYATEDAVFLFRPWIYLGAPMGGIGPGSEFYIPEGKSEFAVAEEHFFLLEQPIWP